MKLKLTIFSIAILTLVLVITTTQALNYQAFKFKNPTELPHEIQPTVILQDKILIGHIVSVANDITTNGTDFWIPNQMNSYIYHLNADGENQSDGFNTSTVGAMYPVGITTNGTDLWVVGRVTNRIYHFDLTGNFIDSFSLASSSTGNPTSVTTDGTYLWVHSLWGDNPHSVSKYDIQGNFINRFSVVNKTNSGRGVTTNGTDIWTINWNFLLDNTTVTGIHHYDLNGNVIDDPIETKDQFNIPIPYGITTDKNINHGPVTDFWIVGTEGFGGEYHIFHLIIQYFPLNKL